MNKVLLYIKDSDGTFQEVDLFEDETITGTTAAYIYDIEVFKDLISNFIKFGRARRERYLSTDKIVKEL